MPVGQLASPLEEHGPERTVGKGQSFAEGLGDRHAACEGIRQHPRRRVDAHVDPKDLGKAAGPDAHLQPRAWQVAADAPQALGLGLEKGPAPRRVEPRLVPLSVALEDGHAGPVRRLGVDRLHRVRVSATHV